MLEDCPLRVTVAVKLAAVSSAVDASAIEREGVASSSVTVITPVASEIEAFVALLKTTSNVS